MKKTRTHWLSQLLIGAIIIWTLFPIWMAFVLSVKQPADFFTAKFIPFFQFVPTLDHWRSEWNAFSDPAGMGRGLWNSTVTATITTGLSLLMGGMAGYALALRTHDRQSVGWILAIVLIPRIVPPVVLVLPFMLLANRLHLDDTLFALVFAHTTLTLPITIFLLFSAICEIPFDLIEAAQIDGCSRKSVYWRVVVPLLMPAIIATAALCFAQSWNEFLFAVTNAGQQMQTAPLAVASLLNKDGIEFEYVGSHLLMVILPPLLLALLVRGFVVRGFSFGLLKEEALA